MATVVENKKNGKTVSYKFRAYLGRNEVGKQINRYTTWFAPDTITLRQSRKHHRAAGATSLAPKAQTLPRKPPSRFREGEKRFADKIF